MNGLMELMNGGVEGWMDGGKEGGNGESNFCTTNICIPGQSSQHVQGCSLQFHEPLPTPGSTRMDVGTAPHAECRVVHLSCDFRSAMYP